jgi:hypothetical protein
VCERKREKTEEVWEKALIFSSEGRERRVREMEIEAVESKARGVPTHGGRYVQYNVLGNLFEVSAKYVPPIHPVGRGAYGIVWYIFCFPFLSFQPLPLVFESQLSLALFTYIFAACNEYLFWFCLIFNFFFFLGFFDLLCLYWKAKQKQKRIA